MDATQLRIAIGAHSMWKTRLAAAVRSGAPDLDSVDLARDDACEFGRWLYCLPAEMRGPEWRSVCECHRAFHTAAAAVAALVEVGDPAGAQRLMAAGSQFATASTECTLAMLGWIKRLP